MLRDERTAFEDIRMSRELREQLLKSYGRVEQGALEALAESGVQDPVAQRRVLRDYAQDTLGLGPGDAAMLSNMVLGPLQGWELDGKPWSREMVNVSLDLQRSAHFFNTRGYLYVNIFLALFGTPEIGVGARAATLEAKLLNGYSRLEQTGGAVEAFAAAAGKKAINPALEERLVAYKAWKVRAGIEGTPASKEFRRFMGAHRPSSRGATLFSSRSGFARWSRMVNRMHGHHAFPQAFRRQFGRIGIDVDDFVFDVPGGNHLRTIHGGGPRGGVYNQFWEDFFAGQHGPVTRSNALQLLDSLRSKGFKVP
jgi:hypothetical protein